MNYKLNWPLTAWLHLFCFFFSVLIWCVVNSYDFSKKLSMEIMTIIKYKVPYQLQFILVLDFMMTSFVFLINFISFHFLIRFVNFSIVIWFYQDWLMPRNEIFHFQTSFCLKQIFSVFFFFKKQIWSIDCDK